MIADTRGWYRLAGCSRRPAIFGVDADSVGYSVKVSVIVLPTTAPRPATAIDGVVWFRFLPGDETAFLFRSHCTIFGCGSLAQIKGAPLRGSSTFVASGTATRVISSVNSGTGGATIPTSGPDGFPATPDASAFVLHRQPGIYSTTNPQITVCPGYGIAS